MLKLYFWLDKTLPKNYALQIFSLFLIKLIFSLSLNFALGFFDFESFKEISNSRKNENKILLFFGIVIFAPLFETFLYHWLPIFVYTSIREIRRYDFILVIIISILFGLSHGINYVYMFSAFFAGLLYCLIAFYYEQKGMNFFIPILIIHFLNNLLAFTKYI